MYRVGTPNFLKCQSLEGIIPGSVAAVFHINMFAKTCEITPKSKIICNAILNSMFYNLSKSIAISPFSFLKLKLITLNTISKASGKLRIKVDKTKPNGVPPKTNLALQHTLLLPE